MNASYTIGLPGPATVQRVSASNVARPRTRERRKTPGVWCMRSRSAVRGKTDRAGPNTTEPIGRAGEGFPAWWRSQAVEEHVLLHLETAVAKNPMACDGWTDLPRPGPRKSGDRACIVFPPACHREVSRYAGMPSSGIPHPLASAEEAPLHPPQRRRGPSSRGLAREAGEPRRSSCGGNAAGPTAHRPPRGSRYRRWLGTRTLGPDWFAPWRLRNDLLGTIPRSP